MSNVTGQMNPEVTINSMSSNMILRFDPDGTIWAKISQPRQYPDTSPGIVYINGKLKNTSSLVFVKIFN